MFILTENAELFRRFPQIYFLGGIFPICEKAHSSVRKNDMDERIDTRKKRPSYDRMKKRNPVLLIVLFLLYAGGISAQWDAPFSHYWMIRGYYNPSFAGETDQIRTSAIYRYQWVNVKNAPTKTAITADMPFEFLNRRHGVGLVVFSENMGNVRNSLLAAQYTFKKQFGKSFLNFGIQAGMNDLKFDAGSIRFITDSTRNNTRSTDVDPAEKRVLELNAGISWTNRNVFAGISVLHINQPTFYAQKDTVLSEDIQTDSLRSSIPRSYNFIAGCNITLPNPLYEIQPMVWIQSDLTTTQVQATLRMVYRKKYSGGVSWRRNDGYVFFAGATIRDMEIGYAYDLHITGAGKGSKGSHEVYLRYNFPFDLFRQERQPHKSIRIL